MRPTKILSEGSTKFFMFNQNNSYGEWDTDHRAGLSLAVVIEARDAAQANALARLIGIYFSGKGDCPCCGNRWYEVDDCEGKEEFDPEDSYMLRPGYPFRDRAGGPVLYVHYLSGRIVGYGPTEETEGE